MSAIEHPQHAHVAPPREPELGRMRFTAADQASARLDEIDREHPGLRFLALAVVHDQCRDDRRQHRQAQSVRIGSRLGDRTEGCVHIEGQLIRRPSVGGPTVVATDLLWLICLDRAGYGGWRDMLDAVIHSRAGIGQASLDEGEAADRLRRIARSALDADEDALTSGFADLQPNSSAAAEMPAGKTHERTHGRVLRVEVDVVDTHCLTAPLVRPLMNSR